MFLCGKGKLKCFRHFLVMIAVGVLASMTLLITHPFMTRGNLDPSSASFCIALFESLLVSESCYTCVLAGFAFGKSKESGEKDGWL